MNFVALTVTVLVIFLLALIAISYAASRKNVPTPDDFYLANRGIGTVVMVMTMGASFFSTWTLLGAIGSYYRGGVWFIGFAAWTVVHALFIWLFGARIWLLGKKYHFVTPGDLVESYYSSPVLRILFAVVGIVGLVPYMLIQVTGGASALSSLTGDQIPYWVGVLIMAGLVGVLVTVSGGRGAAWGDTFMGFFFGTVLIIVATMFFAKSGGMSAFKNLEPVAPDILVNAGNVPGILELALGLGLGYWIMPHMWQKFYSAKSAAVLAKTSVITPFWNSWLMALLTLSIGLLAHTPGLIPGLNNENSDQIIPLFFASYAPFFGTIVIAAIIAAGISTINSQLLSSASLLVSDIYVRFFNPNATESRKTFLGRLAVIGLTLLILILAFLPSARGYLVPLSSLGFAISIQLVPAALGPLMWRGATRQGAIWSILVGEAVLALVYLTKIVPLGPGTSGIIAAAFTFYVVSFLTQSQPSAIQREFHDTMDHYLYGEAPPVTQKV